MLKSKFLVIILTLLVPIMLISEFNQVFAAVITSGEYNNDRTQYTMKAWGSNYHSYGAHGGDPWFFVIDNTSFRLSDAWVKYVFQVPAELYDHQLIEKFTVKLKYDRTDWGDKKSGSENLPPTLQCYDRENSHWDTWRDLDKDVCDGCFTWAEVTTSDIYPDDSQFHIEDSGGEKYQIHIQVDAPDGQDSGDDDAEVDIDELHVVLHLRHPHNPNIEHIAPAKGKNGKVNVPLSKSIKFAVEAEDISGKGYDVKQYQWKKQTASEDAPSITTDWSDKTTEPKKNYTFSDTGDYKVYCKVIYEDDRDENIISELHSVPVRVWEIPVVDEAPPSAELEAGTISWYDGQYVGIVEKQVKLVANVSDTNLYGNEVIEKYLWDFDNNWDTEEDQLIQPVIEGVVGEFYQYRPSDVENNIDSIENYIRDNNVSPYLIKSFNTVNFPSSSGNFKHSGGYDTGLSDYFFVRLTGHIEIPGPGEYDFHVSSDDGFRLRINGEEIASHPNTRAMGETTGTYSFKNPGIFPIELTYFEWDGSNGLKLQWTAPYGTKEIISAWSRVAVWTWENSTTNGQIACKAFTNYGIESEKQNFDLKIYNDLQVDPGDSYAGRPNKPVEFEGFINKNSYAGSSFEYQWRVNSIFPEYSLIGDAERKYDEQGIEYIELTPNDNSLSGQFETSDLPLGDKWSVTGEFWTGGGDGADAFYIYVWANSTPTSEGSNSGQYSIAFDEYTDEIQLVYAGNALASVEQNDIDNGTWYPFLVNFDQGKFQIYLDHSLRLEYNDSSNYQNRMSNNLFGFGARTGGRKNYHCVRNVKWTTGEVVETDNQGKAEYTWTEEGIHQVSLTAKVTTSEGLVIEDTQMAEVTIESGRPTAIPGGPYRGGIAGGNFSPIQFEGNPPDYLEAEDIGHIDEWLWFFPDEAGFSDEQNGALNLDGDDYIVANPVKDFPTDALTVEFWMKSSDDSRTGTPISYASSKSDNDFIIFDYKDFVFYVANKKIVPYREINGEQKPLKVSANDGNWHHIAVTWKSSNGELILYKDGAKVFSGNVAQGLSITDNGAFVVGQEQDSVGGSFDSSQAFVGNIDEVRVWNTVQTEENIRNNMGKRLEGTEQGLVLYWSMEGYTESTVVDLSNSANDGSLADNMNKSDNWSSGGHPIVVSGDWNPTYHFAKDGEYKVGLKVRSEYGKWSYLDTTKVKAIDGKIAGYVKAADLRTPVRNVRMTFMSSHVDPDILKHVATYDDDPIFNVTQEPFQEELDNLTISEALKQKFKDNGISLSNDAKVTIEEIAVEWLIIDNQEYNVKKENGNLNVYNDRARTNSEGNIYTVTDKEGYYYIEHIPLGSYRISANKKEGDTIHEFEKKVQATELTLNAPEQNAIDFVDLSVFPISGRIVYSIQKNGEDVFVQKSVIKAQAVSSTNTIESLPSTKSQNATGGNYNMPLFSGKYLFKAEREAHDIRIKESTPDYDPDTGLVTIDRSRTDIDFVDYTTRELTVFVEDSGGYPISAYPETGDLIEISVSGTNGQELGNPDEEEGKLVVEMNPGKYTVNIKGADPEEKEVDLTGGDEVITMIIPVKIELAFIIPEDESTYKPRFFDVDEDFLAQFGLTEDDNPEGYMYYYPSEPREHTYIIEATANGNPVADFKLFIKDEISMITEDPPDEQEIQVASEDSDDNQTEYSIIAGYPKMNREVDPPLAAPKKITFRAEKEGYKDSDYIEDEVTVLGDVAVGSAEKIVSIPIVNYTVLHDPPGDGSYSYLDDTLSLKGIVSGMTIKIDEKEVPVYPSPWRDEREVDDFEFKKDPDATGDEDFKDMEDKGLLDSREHPVPAAATFTLAAIAEAATGALTVWAGPLAFAAQIAKIPILGVSLEAGTAIPGYTGILQYEVSPTRHLETPSGDELPDLLGPGKGDIYIGEGWTLGLQTKYRLGIAQKNDGTWELSTEQIETYDIKDQTNQYIYTIRDIENIIKDLEANIAQTDDEKEKKKLRESKNTWQDLLNNNLAYKWSQDIISEEPKSLDDFDKDNDLPDDFETLIFSAGPTFEYSRSISEGINTSVSIEVSVGSEAHWQNELEAKTGWVAWGSGIQYNTVFGASASVSSGTSFGSSWEGGRAAEQTVGFVLNDDDIGDNITTRVYEDPRWGTPLFLHDPGSVTSDPWEPGTNKGIDITMELIEEPSASEYFDYHDGAHYMVKVDYTGERDLDTFVFDFQILASSTGNPDNVRVEFNGCKGPYSIGLEAENSSATVDVDIFPPKKDIDKNEEKQYSIDIVVLESADGQIARSITFKPKFADLRAPRAIVNAPYNGERISPVFFPDDEPFKIEVVSEDTDLESIKLQIRSKQPDGVWEPWQDLSGLAWQNPDVFSNADNSNVKVFTRLDRDPERREFTFEWKQDQIQTLGVGEYALRAVATDQARRADKSSGNVDLDPPFVVFQVDDSKPIVLTTTPDYQARESERIYRGELSALFNDDMRADDFDDRTFYVTDLLKANEKVAGYVSYSPALRKAVFVPVQPFQPNGFYRVEIKTDKKRDDGTVEKGLHDLAGNPLDAAFMWTFRTKDAPFEPTWSLTLSATDGNNTDNNNIAAVEYGAEDGQDEKDALAVPSLTNQLCLSFLNRDKVEFDRDIRPADGRLSHHWFFVICDAVEGSEVTISYKPSLKLTRETRQYQNLYLVEFDIDGNVTNKINLDPSQAPINDETGEIGYVDAYTYINQREAVRYFRLDVQKVNLVATEIQAGSSGWKFMSVPIVPQRDDPFVNLGDDIDPFQLYKYDTQTNGYKIYPLDIGEVSLQAGHGYFTRLQNDVEIDIGGASNQDDVEIKLNAKGWHALGNPFILPVDVINLRVNDLAFEQAVANGLVEGILYRWNTDAQNSDSYEELTSSSQLQPWDGFWLKTNQNDITLIMPAPAGLENAESPLPNSYNPPMSPTIITHNAPGEFLLRLSLTSDFASDLTTTLGTRQNAKVGLDSFDQSEPPILNETVSVYFNHQDWVDDGAGLYNRDYQPILNPGETRTWKFTVYTKKPDAEMTLSWKNATESLPNDTMFYFRRIDESAAEWQNMREVQSVNLFSRFQSTKISFEVRAERIDLIPLENISVVPGEKQVMLSWTPIDSAFVEGYTIYRQSGNENQIKIFSTLGTHYQTSTTQNEFIDTEIWFEN